MLAQWTNSARIARLSQNACFRTEKQEHRFDASSQLELVQLDSPLGVPDNARFAARAEQGLANEHKPSGCARGSTRDGLITRSAQNR